MVQKSTVAHWKIRYWPPVHSLRALATRATSGSNLMLVCADLPEECTGQPGPP